MNKYPVTSKLGNNYMVKIKKWNDDVDERNNYIEVELYTVKYKLFKKKTTQVYHLCFMNDSSEFNDYVRATKELVNTYEESNTYSDKVKEASVINEYKKWNGVV